MKIGIIGGSGLDDPKLIKNSSEIDVYTKYGRPSCKIREGYINGVDIALISRHGRFHQIPPTQVNNRANLLALKEIGVTHILATSAVGSLREEIGRGHFVFVDQFIDFTKHRISTFHDDFTGGMKHISMAEPFDAGLRKKMIETSIELGYTTHNRGTVITIEGPRFSTKAESAMFRLLNADVINMSTAPEASLANELGIPYALVAVSTDYDCWKDDENPVSFEEVLTVFEQNVKRVKTLLISTISSLKR
ncbi:MAG: S-methyl-5'-thioadenosine phosphorylase [Bacteroidales bacterium]|nr:S-methyl-5'-thioadenosine phosphorylase [Bacteroidales bacterium]MCF8456624.1 S-methyl-5'-thioadenosine phosphorylase [Bacteroidales bacterium]